VEPHGSESYFVIGERLLGGSREGRPRTLAADVEAQTPRRATRPSCGWMVAVAAVIMLVWAQAAGAAGSVYTPTRSDDPIPDGCRFDDCSLREAVIASETTSGLDYIDLFSFGPQDYVLQQPIVSPGDTPQTGDLDVTQAVTIFAFGPGDTVIDANYIDRAFDISTTGNLTLSGVTIEHGAGQPGVAGHSHGGGIHNHGTLALRNSTLVFNDAPSAWGGGGLTNAGTGTATLENVTIIGNSLGLGSGTGYGGGIENGGNLKLFNVTIAENSAQTGHGGGISNAVGFFSAGTARLNNTIVGTNTGSDCAGPITSVGNNLASDGSCGFTASGDIPSSDPLFEAAVNNMAGDPFLFTLLSFSPAVDAGSAPYNSTTDTGCMPNDEVATARPQDGNDNGSKICDIGAYERPDTPPTIASVFPAEGKTGVPGGTTVRVTFSEPMDHAATQSAFSLVRNDNGSSVAGVFAWNGNEMVFTPGAALSAGRMYTASVSTAATDSAGTPLESGKSWGFTTTPITVYPGSAVIMVGTLRGGDATRLRRDDNVYYQVNATSAGQLRWYGSFPAVPNSLPKLTVTYKGKNSIACTQRLQLYDWALGTWKQVDARSVGATEVGITATPPSGDYVSGAAGTGELRLRLRCDASVSFFSSGDLMNIKYAAP
jgi:hypothetical protein